MNYITKALEIAIKAHKGEVDKGGKDYIFHPITVALNCKTKQEKTVALLHDVVEDTSITLDDLRKVFSSIIVNAVDAITCRPSEKGSSAGRFQYLERVKKNRIARAVKIADLIHNSDLSRLTYITDKDTARTLRYKSEIEFLKK